VALLKALEKLGVIMSTKFSQCTHLIAPSLVRTEKFLCALAFAPVILQEAWAVKSVQVKQLLRACCTSFILQVLSLVNGLLFSFSCRRVSPI